MFKQFLISTLIRLFILLAILFPAYNAAMDAIEHVAKLIVQSSDITTLMSKGGEGK